MIEKEKHAVRNVNAVAAGRVAGIDPFEEIKQRCIRILDTVEHEDGGCVLCRCFLILCVIRRISVVESFLFFGLAVMGFLVSVLG